MKLLKLVFLCSFLTSLHVSAQADRKERIASYIKQYKNVAIKEQKRVGIPAAITLAQGIHETNAGASELAVNANNHFGIKCKKEWTGDTYTYTDDRPNECFRKYKSDLESYKDHSDYLKNSKRYESLFALSLTDYAGWAYGLKRCGYATNPKYAQILIKTIEENRLQEYTYAALDKDYDPIKEPADQTVVMGSDKKAGVVVPEKDAPGKEIPTPEARPTKMVVTDGTTRYDIIKKTDKPVYGRKVIVNGLKAFYVQKDHSLLNDAMELNMRYARLLELNDLPDAPLEADMYIYLERKNMKGGTTYHVVKPGETMIQIAQYEGIALKELRRYNRMKDDEEPVSGALLHLQEIAVQKPDVIVKKKEKVPREEFPGSESKPIPQGATRMKAGYISKEEIEKGNKTEITTRKVMNEETNRPKTEVTITRPTEVIIDEDALASNNRKLVIEEETTTITPEKEVIVEKVTTTRYLDQEDAPVLVENEKTVINEADDIVVEKKAVIVPAEEVNIVTEEVNSAETKTVAVPEAEVNHVTEGVNLAETKAVAVPAVEIINDIEEENLADTQAVEEEKTETPKAELKPEEPMDEFARLKARLDKAVYASDNAKKKTEDKKITEPDKKEAVPAKKEEAKTAVSSSAKPTAYYTVQKGDSAFAIAKKHGITMTQLKEWNNLDFNEIKVGQKLRVK